MEESNGLSLQPGVKAMDYAETLMYGTYQKDLGEFAKQQAIKNRLHARVHAQRKKDSVPTGFRLYTRETCRACQRKIEWFRDSVISKVGEDWLFLTLLGIVMALLSFIMDYGIEKCQLARKWLYEEVGFNVAAQYFAWTLFPLVFICFSTGFVHVVGPNAKGSGIPEMKTILRGVVLKEYLTFKTLISKIVGLCTSLGCGIPVGKEGPFVHVASIAATLLGKIVTSFRDIYENQTRNSEMLAAACAVGVACTFAAPIGGVLFSIEVTATYFAVRNYWRGFYSAVCGAFMFRLLAIWFKEEETLTALFKTNLRHDFPFDPAELFAFAIIGLVCGFGGALFVFTHRKMVEFMRKHKKVSSFLQKNRFLYPSIVVFLVMSVMFPPGFGQFMAGQLTNREAINELFSNWTWSGHKPDNYIEQEVQKHWEGPHSNIYITLVLFVVTRFWMVALCNTLPVPAGVFMPVFTIGAAFGRLMGESMAVWFPQGIGGRLVVPGGYAIVGAAALSGSVTHTISTSVIVFELTGQMGHVLPCVIAVLIANAVAHTLQPSIYDSLILIKNLPYLPDIIQQSRSVKAHQLRAEDFMVRDLQCLMSGSTYMDAMMLLEEHAHRTFPLVDSKENMILLGSVPRYELESMIEERLSAAWKQNFFDKLRMQRGSVPEVRVTEEADIAELDLDVFDNSQNKPSVQVHRAPSTRSTSSRFTVSRVSDDGSDMKYSSQIRRSSSTDTTDGKKDVPFPIPADIKDLTTEQELFWEQRILMEMINFDECQVDPAPFQLVERTSLYKVHSLFSLLSLHHAYVTNMGRLVGIVALKEVRDAVQGHVITSQQQRREAKGRDQDIDEAPSSPLHSQGGVDFSNQFSLNNDTSSSQA